MSSENIGHNDMWIEGCGKVNYLFIALSFAGFGKLQLQKNPRTMSIVNLFLYQEANISMKSVIITFNSASLP